MNILAEHCKGMRKTVMLFEVQIIHWWLLEQKHATLITGIQLRRSAGEWNDKDL